MEVTTQVAFQSEIKLLGSCDLEMDRFDGLGLGGAVPLPVAGMIGVSFTGTFPADLAGSADNVVGETAVVLRWRQQPRGFNTCLGR